MLVISDTDRILILNKHDALDLELKLNITSFGHMWSSIGDDLFNYATKTDSKTSILITAEQYDFLKILTVKSRDECYKL